MATLVLVPMFASFNPKKFVIEECIVKYAHACGTVKIHG